MQTKALGRIMRSSQPAKASFWFTACNVVNKGLALLATPILTRIMTTEQYGSFSVFQSWVSIFTIFCSLNLFQSAYSRGLVAYKGSEGAYCSSLLGLSTTLTLAVSLLVFMSLDFWTSVMAMSPLLVALMFIEIIFTTSYEFWAATQRFNYRYRALVTVSIAMNFLSLFVGVLAVLFSEYKVEARVIVDVLSKALPGAVLMIIIFARGKRFFTWEFWKYALLFNIPLLPHFLSSYILNQSDRLMIASLSGKEMAALYSVAYSIAMVMTIVVNAINSSYVPYTYKEMSEHRIEGISHTSLPILILVFALCVLVMAFAPEVLTVFAGPEYSEAVYIIPPLSASVFYIFLYSLYSNIEYYYKETATISLASVLCAALNIVLNLAAIPLFGYEAAAWTTLISYIALSIFHGYFCHKICKREQIQDIYPDKSFALLSIAIMCVAFAMIPLSDAPALRYAIISAIVVGVIINRGRIKAVLSRD